MNNFLIVFIKTILIHFSLFLIMIYFIKYNINKVIYYEQILFDKINIMYGKNYLFR